MEEFCGLVFCAQSLRLMEKGDFPWCSDRKGNCCVYYMCWNDRQRCLPISLWNVSLWNADFTSDLSAGHSWWSPPLQQTCVYRTAWPGCSGQCSSQVALQTSLLNDTITHSVPSWTAPKDPQPARSRQNSVQPFKSAPSILPAQRRVPGLSAQHAEVASPLVLQSPFAFSFLLPSPYLDFPSRSSWPVPLPSLGKSHSQARLYAAAQRILLRTVQNYYSFSNVSSCFTALGFQERCSLPLECLPISLHPLSLPPHFLTFQVPAQSLPSLWSLSSLYVHHPLSSTSCWDPLSPPGPPQLPGHGWDSTCHAHLPRLALFHFWVGQVL